MDQAFQWGSLGTFHVQTKTVQANARTFPGHRKEQPEFSGAVVVFLLLKPSSHIL